jgi:hypothetical protein
MTRLVQVELIRVLGYVSDVCLWVCDRLTARVYTITPEAPRPRLSPRQES